MACLRAYSQAGISFSHDRSKNLVSTEKKNSVFPLSRKWARLSIASIDFTSFLQLVIRLDQHPEKYSQPCSCTFHCSTAGCFERRAPVAAEIRARCWQIAVLRVSLEGFHVDLTLMYENYLWTSPSQHLLSRETDPDWILFSSRIISTLRCLAFDPLS